MEKYVADKPQSGIRLSLLAMIEAGSGRKEDAVTEARRACEMEPYGQGSTQAPKVFSNQAVVYAWIGQPDLAFQTLNEAVNHPAGGDLIMQPTYGDFRLDPIWDALRDDPRFEALVQRLAPDQKR
jgi:hypothetical protein